MINILRHVSRQKLGVKGKAISVHDGENKHYPPPQHTHTHTQIDTDTDITDSHLNMLEGFIFYKSSINGKVNVALNKTKLLNCNTALSL